MSPRSRCGLLRSRGPRPVCVPRAGGRARPERYFSASATLLAVAEVPLRKRPDTRDMTPPKKIQTGVVAVAVVGLTAVGAAVAANKLQGTSSSQKTAAAGAFVAASSSTKSGIDRDHHGGPGFRHDDLADAASYLGITQTALETALQSGKTLAQVADATSGKSAAGLIDALVAAEKAELAAAVKAVRPDTGAGRPAHRRPEGARDRRGQRHLPWSTAPVGRVAGTVATATATASPPRRRTWASPRARSSLSSSPGRPWRRSPRRRAASRPPGLVAALVAAEKTELAAAVRGGRSDAGAGRPDLVRPAGTCDRNGQRHPPGARRPGP